SLMNSQKTAYALRGRIGRDLPLHARLSAEKSYAQPGFPGYYSNQDHSNVSLFVPLRSRTHWQTSYNYFIQNLERDTSRSTALREQQVLSGVYWTLPFRTQINLDVESIFRRDALPQQDYHRREQSANLRVRQPFRWLTVGGQIREGTWRDPSNGASGQLERFGGNLTLSPDSRHSYTFSYQTGHSGSQSRTNRIFGLSASLRPLAGLFFSASWQTSDYPDHTPYGSRQLAVDARYTFLRRHTFSLRYRQLEFEEEYLSRGTSWMISYELPLGMPVGRQEKFGAVKGRIRDAERTGQAGLPNVVLMLDGKMALTDRKGNFVFPALEPGVHYLQVEKSSIGLDRVASRRVPLEVKVRGGRTEMVDLGIFRGATLCGEVALFGLGAASARGIFVEADSTMAHDAMDSLNYLYGLSGIEVELRSESETRHAATDCNGRFRFDELRPGRWTLAIASADLPPFHDLESETYVVEIEPASQNDFAVRVVPRRRSVIIVDEGKVPVISKRR
ncbi:carboxypeptidase-like regulatory domain-containing protein, partial [bacterium]|nr:carboxypeptidase-like regulatory domain-containing protein [bacterium]